MQPNGFSQTLNTRNLTLQGVGLAEKSDKNRQNFRRGALGCVPWELHAGSHTSSFPRGSLSAQPHEGAGEPASGGASIGSSGNRASVFCPAGVGRAVWVPDIERFSIVYFGTVLWQPPLRDLKCPEISSLTEVPLLFLD